MSGWLSKIRDGLLELQSEGDAFVDPKDLSDVIDQLEVRRSRVLESGRLRGDHQLSRLTPTSWAARTCGLSRGAASDRLCVGKQLPSLPEVENALESGAISYQKASVICHLRADLGDRLEPPATEDLVDKAKRFSVEHLRRECRQTHYMVDPEGFDRFTEEDFERRWLKVSEMLDGMYSVDGVLDAVTGVALRDTLDALAQWRGPEDRRTHGQRMADGLSELLHHHMSQGRLPRRNGVRPHISMTTTLEGVKRELGAPAAELHNGTLISSKTAQRMACDCTMSRVLLADSVAIDVGRATRTVSPAMRRALHKRDRGCRWPGCDRPVGWTEAHHIQFWSRGGPNKASNLVLLCHFHHRKVHEGEWQVIRAGNDLDFIPPEHLKHAYARAPSTVSWAA